MKYIWSGLSVLALVLILLTVPLITEGTVANSKLLAVVGFWLFWVALAVLPYGFQLEIGEDFVESRFFGVTVSHVRSSDILAVEYGRLFRGGLGFGRGLNYTALINGKRRTYSIGEKFYGKQAIEHAQSVLRKRLVAR